MQRRAALGLPQRVDLSGFPGRFSYLPRDRATGAREPLGRVRSERQPGVSATRRIALTSGFGDADTPSGIRDDVDLQRGLDIGVKGHCHLVFSSAAQRPCT